MKSENTAKGFTLVELMTVVAIIAVIAAIAWPQYTGTQMRARRSDAILGILAAQGFLEKCYTEVRDYTDASCTLPASIAASPKGYYAIALAASATDSYELQATPVAGGLQAGDADCAVISITNTGNKTNSTNTFCWAQ